MFPNDFSILGPRKQWHQPVALFTLGEYWRRLFLAFDVAKGQEWGVDMAKGNGTGCDVVGANENAGVEKLGAGRRGGKFSRLAIRKAEPRLYSETALSYFLRLLSE